MMNATDVTLSNKQQKIFIFYFEFNDLNEFLMILINDLHIQTLKKNSDIFRHNVKTGLQDHVIIVRFLD